MEESFKEGSKDYKGKRSVQNKLSENRGNNIVTIVTIVNYIKYSEKIVNTKNFGCCGAESGDRVGAKQSPLINQ